MDMYKESAAKLLAASSMGHDAAAAPVNAPAVGTVHPETTPRTMLEPRNAEQQQAWLSARAAAVGQQLVKQEHVKQEHVKQEQFRTPSSQRSDQSSQAAQAQPRPATTPVQPSLFMPTASTAQRGSDHRIRNDRRSAERGLPAVPKFAALVTGSKRSKPDSPEHAVKPPPMQEFIETDMF